MSFESYTLRVVIGLGNTLMSQTTQQELQKKQLNGKHNADLLPWNEQKKIEVIQKHFAAILESLGLDLKDANLRETPKRVAQMYVRELFSGLNPKNKPELSLFENDSHYGQMLVEKNICFHSICEHHFLPIIGRAHVAYIPGKKIIGLSKINRIVNYYASRPQVQERLTVQIHEELSSVLKSKDLAVWIDAVHLCLSSRGIRDQHSSTLTAKYSGKFIEEEECRNEFLSYIRQPSPKII